VEQPVPDTGSANARTQLLSRLAFAKPAQPAERPHDPAPAGELEEDVPRPAARAPARKDANDLTA